jgi:hypothetical protein
LRAVEVRAVDLRAVAVLLEAVRRPLAPEGGAFEVASAFFAAVPLVRVPSACVPLAWVPAGFRPAAGAAVSFRRCCVSHTTAAPAAATGHSTIPAAPSRPTPA